MDFCDITVATVRKGETTFFLSVEPKSHTDFGDITVAPVRKAEMTLFAFPKKSTGYEKSTGLFATLSKLMTNQ